MKTRFVLLLLSLAAVAAVTFAARQRTLNEVRNRNETLRRQLEAPAAPDEPNAAAAVQPTNATDELSAAERSELLRLRGEVLPLLGELQTASNRVAEFARTKPERPNLARDSGPGTNQDEQLPPGIQAHMQVMNTYQRSPAFRDAQRFGSALRNYLSQSGGQLPDDLAKVEPYGEPGLPSGVSGRFEQMQSGPVPEEARSYTLFAREKDPQQQTDGWYERIYFFADGNMSTLGSSWPSPNWTTEEHNLETRRRKQAQQRQNGTPH